MGGRQQCQLPTIVHRLHLSVSREEMCVGGRCLVYSKLDQLTFSQQSDSQPLLDALSVSHPEHCCCRCCCCMCFTTSLEPILSLPVVTCPPRSRIHLLVVVDVAAAATFGSVCALSSFAVGGNDMPDSVLSPASQSAPLFRMALRSTGRSGEKLHLAGRFRMGQPLSW